MSAVTLSQPPTIRYEADNARKLEALEQFIELGQGSFYFAPVQFDLPSLRNEVLGKLREKFPHLNLVTVRLTPPPADAARAYHVLDQLRDLVKLESPDQPPDTLIITNYESLFPEAVKANDGRITDELVRAIQPLNLGRNLFAEAFQCPVLLCLPPPAMGVFLRSAPDLVSWKSGFFKFESNPEAVRAELEQEAGTPMSRLTRWKLGRRAPEELFTETKRLEALIADAEAMRSESLPDADRLIARLYHRLGWMAVALKDRLQARRAFGEMLQCAKEAEDQRLIGAAEHGQHAADAIAASARLSPKQSSSVREVFRGAAALGEAEGLYGREDELNELASRVTRVDTRFLIVWGETGCGKTSLVLAGLLPELKRQGHYLSIVVRQWEEPEAAIRQALYQASRLALDSFETLRDCIGYVARQTQKTVVVVCDQFEQFFTAHLQRGARQPLIKAISACVNDLRIPCKFLFILREDHLGRMVEFESDVPEAIGQSKRFYLPLFNAADAARVLRQQAGKARLDWPENFVRAVVSNLTREERVRPIELQLVGAALAVSGISNETDFAREGRAQGLMVEYLRLTLDSLGQSQGPVRTMKQILLALVAEQAARLALTPEKIARRAAVNLGEVRRLLNPLLTTHLIRRVEDSNVEASAADDANARYELTHDVLVELVLILTRDLQDKRRQAARVLTRAIEDLSIKPRHTIGLRDWNLARRHGDESLLAKPKVKEFLRRSLFRGVLKNFLLPLLLVLAAIMFIRQTFSYVVIEQDFNDRIVIRRGLPWLGLLGNDVLVDTGYSAIRDVERDKREELQGLIHWQWDNRLGGVMEGEEFVTHLDSAAREGLLLCQTGQINAGIEQLADALKSNNADITKAARNALNQTAQTVPQATLTPLLEMFKQVNISNDPVGSVRSAVAAALGQVAQADHSLASQTLLPLLDLLKQFNISNDPRGDVRSDLTAALGQVAQADPNARNQVFGLLTNYDEYVRAGVTTPLAKLIFNLSEEEKKAGRDPLRWLFDHLEGRQSLLPGGNANTHAVYRTVVVGALGRWLASDKPEMKADQERLQQWLAQMRDTDRQVHLRIAAWNVFVEAARLREEKQK